MGLIEKVANPYWVRGGTYYEKGDCIMFDRCDGSITPTAVDSEGFIKAIRERLEAKLA